MKKFVLCALVALAVAGCAKQTLASAARPSQVSYKNPVECVLALATAGRPDPEAFCLQVAGGESARALGTAQAAAEALKPRPVFDPYSGGWNYPSGAGAYPYPSGANGPDGRNVVICSGPACY